MNNKIIYFSGSCHSGKTQAMKNLINDKIIYHNEIIRTKNLINIDNLRNKSKKYLKYELEIISKKIFQEEECLNKFENKIIIFDRSLIDSLYYYLIYFNKTLFSEKNLIKYELFLQKILDKIKKHINNNISHIILFEPIFGILEKDKYRPKYLKYIQQNEFEIIKALTYGFVKNKSKILKINIQKDEKKLKNFIENLL